NSRHKDYTCEENGLILENIRKLANTGIPYIIRTPLIPGITDTDKNIREIALFIKDLPGGGLLYYELLNFNPLGEAKFKAMGKANPLEKERPLPPEKLDRIRLMLEGMQLGYKYKVS
ncbi:MAG: glycyl-radical enzyme activating protein, partial [Eubacteriales bacterium]|nr:glycyl-radical enzyme activating protein [Eubacteriales bacterium]